MPAATHHHAEKPNRYSSRSASHAPATPPLLAIGAPVPEYDQPWSVLVYVARISASQMNAATMTSHHDSRTRRAKRGESGADSRRAATAAWRDDRRGSVASFLLKNIALPH